MVASEKNEVTGSRNASSIRGLGNHRPEARMIRARAGPVDDCSLAPVGNERELDVYGHTIKRYCFKHSMRLCHISQSIISHIAVVAILVYTEAEIVRMVAWVWIVDVLGDWCMNPKSLADDRSRAIMGNMRVT